LDVFPAVKDGGFHTASLESHGTTLKSNSLTFGRGRHLTPAPEIHWPAVES
jgi:hypothetical protein